MIYRCHGGESSFIIAFMVFSTKLSDILAELPPADTFIDDEIRISGVTMDSRIVRPGFIFVAIAGGTIDGHTFISDALKHGASAIVGEKSQLDLGQDIGETPYFQVRDGRAAVSRLAAAFHGFPARKMAVIGVTGTDGKTTTATLIHQVLIAAGFNAGLISTVNAVIRERTLDTGFHVTTPDAPTVQDLLAQMVSQNVSHVVIEATSHGLAQYRVNDCEFDMAVLTNLSHEHLDYHRSFDSYRNAKGLLFKILNSTVQKPFNPPRGAVLNKDDDTHAYFSGITETPVLSYGRNSEAEVTAKDIQHNRDGLRFSIAGHDLDGSAFNFPVDAQLFGDFNIYNYLAAAALTRGIMQIDDGIVAEGLSRVGVISGRMEPIDVGQDFKAVVDFAHTPNALQKALQAGRSMISGRVITVVGSAGLRDREKRGIMGKIAAENADLVFITAEDPRTDSLRLILEEMAAGAQKGGGEEGKSFWRVLDRREAIRLAVRAAGPDDLVLICGKGHEQSMCFGDVEYTWDDRTALRAAISEHLGLPGPVMPYLPTIELLNKYESAAFFSANSSELLRKTSEPLQT